MRDGERQRLKVLHEVSKRHVTLPLSKHSMRNLLLGYYRNFSRGCDSKNLQLDTKSA